MAAADLMLAVAHGNRDVHHDRLDLVLFSTILCASMRAVSRRPELARAYACIAQKPPDMLRRPIRVRRLAGVLGLAEATVRLRLDRLIEGPVEETADGLVIREAWLASPAAIETSIASYRNLRRLIGGMAAQGFPVNAPERAYVGRRPPLVSFALDGSMPAG